MQTPEKIYAFDQTYNQDGEACPESGTLEDAIAWCKGASASLDLFDDAGFRKGWVKADGSWSLT